MSRTDKDRHRRWEPGRRYYDSPPPWFVNHVWDAPERLAARVDCARAAAEYRATGEVDTVPTTRQHRQCAIWLWS